MATATLMTLKELATELGVSYSHVWKAAKENPLIEYQRDTYQHIITVDDEKMKLYRRAVEIRDEYGIGFPRALRMIHDGWTKPEQTEGS